MVHTALMHRCGGWARHGHTEVPFPSSQTGGDQSWLEYAVVAMLTLSAGNGGWTLGGHRNKTP